MITWLITHLVSILVVLLTLVFAASILGQRRPTGSALAWLLAVVLIPYVGIPLYLMIGGRKFRRQALSKKALERRARPAQPVEHVPIDWLDDGVEAYAAFLREIRAAKRAIRIETYLIGNDHVGKAVLDALAERAAAGVAVHLLIDDFLITTTPRRPLRELQAAGGKVARFMPLFHIPFRGRANLRNHRKIAVFDGARAIVGGMNLGDEYMGPTPLTDRWRDVSIVVGGSAVAALDAIFRADWEFAAREAIPPLADDAASIHRDLVVMPSGPDCRDDQIYDAILTAVFRAERRLWVATPYYVPDEALARALEIAVRRGVDVRVIVPARSNHWIADICAGPSLRELETAGGRIHRYTPGMLHAKLVLADEAIAIVGSANFDMRSMFLNYEVATSLTGASEIARVARWFDDTFQSCEIGAPRARWLRARIETTARLVAPLV